LHYASNAVTDLFFRQNSQNQPANFMSARPANSMSAQPADCVFPSADCVFPSASADLVLSVFATSAIRVLYVGRDPGTREPKFATITPALREKVAAIFVRYSEEYRPPWWPGYGLMTPFNQNFLSEFTYETTLARRDRSFRPSFVYDNHSETRTSITEHFTFGDAALLDVGSLLICVASTMGLGPDEVSDEFQCGLKYDGKSDVFRVKNQLVLEEYLRSESDSSDSSETSSLTEPDGWEDECEDFSDNGDADSNGDVPGCR
jgi:hypothetical protein